jgi:virulence factor Mce-like protein
MSYLQRRIGPYATRVVVISALVLGAFALVWAITSSSRGSYEMKAQFDDVRGLIPGGEVRAGAVNVGSVTSVELGENDVPTVTFSVKDEFELYEGATADIRLGSNVGAVNRTIELTEGDPTAEELPEGYMFRGDATDQPVNFDLAVQTLNPKTRDDIKSLLIGLDEAIKGRGADFDRTLDFSDEALTETSLLLKQVNEDGEALRTLTGEGQRVVSALASNPEALGTSADRIALLLATTGNRQAELEESARLLGPALSDGRRLLDRLSASIPNARAFVRDLRPTVTELTPLVRLLPEAARAGGPFLEETRILVEQGPSDLRKFKPVIDAAAEVAPQLDEVATDLLPIGQVLRAFQPETLGAFQNFGAATGTYDAVGHVLTTFAGDGQQGPPPSTKIPPIFGTPISIGDSDCTTEGIYPRPSPGFLEKPFVRVPGNLVCQPWTDYEDSFLEIPPPRNP